MTILLLTPDAVSFRDEYTENRWFYRTGLGIREVPNDIPDAALYVELRDNAIETIRANAFLRLKHCIYLSLDHNIISRIEDNAFNGLISLEMLHLRNNRLTKITIEMFSSFLPSCLF